MREVTGDTPAPAGLPCTLLKARPYNSFRVYRVLVLVWRSKKPDANI
jgi:hypothetical protein